MIHTPAFLALVEKAKSHIKELSLADVQKKFANGDKFLFIDVREDEEWKVGRAKGAIHLGKGVIERDIETLIPDKNTQLVLYCGGGFRSALAADSIQQMGYTNVYSMDGGIKAWRSQNLPEDKD